MKISSFGRLLFGLALCLFSISKTAAQNGMPNLIHVGPVRITSQTEFKIFYEFTIKNGGDGRADLRRMEVVTKYVTLTESSVKTDLFKNMRLTSAQNPKFLEPGQEFTVKYKIVSTTRLAKPMAPNSLCVSVDSNDSILEMYEPANAVCNQ